MNRRALLAVLAGGSAALAGCSLGDDANPTVTPAALDDETETPTDAPDDSRSEPTTDDGDGDDADGSPDRPFGGANVGSLAAGNRRVAFPYGYRGEDEARIDLELVDDASADGPLTFEATLTNANRWENTFALRWLPPFGDPYGGGPVGPDGERLDVTREQGSSSGMAFAPTGDGSLAERAPALERDDEGYWRLAETGTWLPETVRLDADESVTVEFALVGHPDGEGRPTGTYRWSPRDEGFAVRVWDEASPGPDGESRFAGESVPDLPRDGPTRWFHEADEGTTAYLRPSVERAATPARIDFAMLNHGGTPLGGNTYDWGLYRLADGEWFHLGPYEIPMPYTSVPPGGSDTWTLGAFAGDAPDFEESTDVGHLGGGRYAFRVSYSRLDGEGEARGGVHAALFDLDAPALDVTPTADVSVESVEDGEVTVRSERYDDAGEYRERTSLALEAVADDGDAERVVAEQVMRRRFRGLRNTLAFVDDADLADRAGGDVERVVLLTDDYVADDAVGYDADRRTVRFEGTTYRLTASVE